MSHENERPDFDPALDFAQDQNMQLQRLIQELKTHQIELEMQNEELVQAQQLLADQKDKYRDLYDFAPVAFFVLDRYNIIADCNLTAAVMFGTPRPRLIKKPFRLLVVPEDHDTFLDLMQRPLRAERGHACEFDMLRTGGGRFHARVEADVVRGEPNALRLAIMDISDRFNAEQALLEAKRELEQKVQERTAQLARTVDELKVRSKQLQGLTNQLIQAEHRERKRVAQILHDSVQQQLAAANLAIGGLYEAVRDPQVKDEISRIEELIGESIRTSRSLTTELSPQALGQGLTPGLEWLSKWFGQKHGLKIDLMIEARQLVLSDNIKMLLFDSVRELLFNVVKHSGTDTARIELSTVNGFILLTVSDHGRGFEPSQTPAPDAEGGFGLFSIQERLLSLDGQLVIESAPGNGSRFTIRVPHETPSASGDDRTIRLILVDDHSAIRESLARMLGRERDIDVVGQASDGEGAIELTEKLLPDTIVMDVEMPGTDGIEATRRIRAKHPRTRIIAFSMHTDSGLAQAMCDAGASNYLTKSCSLEELVKAIRASA